MNKIVIKTLVNELTPVEALSRKIYRLTESARGESRTLEQVVLRLHGCGEREANRRWRERESFKTEVARACMKRRGELPKEKDYEENPLDDQEKLDEIRRQVFGSAPNSKQQPATKLTIL